MGDWNMTASKSIFLEAVSCTTNPPPPPPLKKWWIFRVSQLPKKLIVIQ
jgi:hypothetical protein